MPERRCFAVIDEILQSIHEVLSARVPGLFQGDGVAKQRVCRGERIRHQLSIRALRPGDKLPAERELAVQFGVSRSALREALRSLEIAGIVELRKGVKGGAFIRPGDPTRLLSASRAGSAISSDQIWAAGASRTTS